MPLRLLVTDIDGTLLDDSHNLPEINREALLRCRERGVVTCLATGRRWTTCSRLLDRVQIRPLVDYCLLNNGMILQHVGENRIVHEEVFALPDVLAVVARLNALGLDPIALGHNPDLQTKDVFYRDRLAPSGGLLNHDFIEKNPESCLRLEEWTELAGAHVVELAFIGTQRDLEAAAASLSGLDVEIAILKNSYYKEYLLEITPPGISKLSGVRHLMARLGVAEAEVLAVGDSHNDFTMLKHLPRSVAVANGDPMVKAAARELTASNGEGGFGRAVLRHLDS